MVGECFVDCRNSFRMSLMFFIVNFIAVHIVRPFDLDRNLNIHRIIGLLQKSPLSYILIDGKTLIRFHKINGSYNQL